MATPARRGIAVAVLALATVFISAQEGEDHVAVHNKFDPPGVVTFCQGLTNFDDPTVKVGQKFSEEECSKRFAQTLPVYEAQLESVIHVPLPTHRHVALLSFVYNVGEGTLRRSSVARQLNAGNVAAGCQALLLYTRAAGKVLPGLVKRREMERQWCLRND